jgi:proton-translocating NAD(P)+ transhydrogenase subunit alpha
VKVGILKETYPGEQRVALIPGTIPALTKAGLQVVIESDSGKLSGFNDSEYKEKGAEVLGSRSEVFAQADIILQVRSLGSNPEAGKADLELMKQGQIIIGMMDPLTELGSAELMAQKGVISFSMEIIPRITRAQSMDVLSSMATIAGYKAVLIAAGYLPKMFPMMMTAAGTIAAARVFVIGAGVAGLQAIASAKRLGAIVHAYDLRPAVKEQVQSLGGKFVEIDLDAGDSEDKGGYAKAMDEEFYRKQREKMMEVAKQSDVIITTAAIPGKKAPILITNEMISQMKPGSVIVDLAAERGGNCEATKPNEKVVINGVTVLGPTNLMTTVPYHASQMYSKNISTFLLNMVKEGKVELNMEDEIIKETMVTKDGNIVNSRVKEILSSGSSKPNEGSKPDGN